MHLSFCVEFYKTWFLFHFMCRSLLESSISIRTEMPFNPFRILKFMIEICWSLRIYNKVFGWCSAGCSWLVLHSEQQPAAAAERSEFISRGQIHLDTVHEFSYDLTGWEMLNEGTESPKGESQAMQISRILKEKTMSIDTLDKIRGYW